MITPPAMLGVLGGGQLGRYFVIAARTMGYRTMVLDPDQRAPAGGLADVHLVHAYDHEPALAEMAAKCAVVTTEFENPPAATLRWLAQHTIVRPSPAAVAITQDRRAEKQFLQRIGVPLAPFAIIEARGDLDGAATVGCPSILKTARMGYDGKGQVAVAAPAELEDAWNQLGNQPCVLERRLTLEREVSVVLARGIDGEVVAYPVADNTHVDGILDCTVVPCTIPGAAETATAMATTIATALDYVGVLAVELFVVDGALVVNELAPRPHNSGHWTLDAARTSQFQQQVRAICGAALGEPALHAPAAAMVNLLGELWERGEPDWSAALSHSSAALHLYGKEHPRPGRKMGHLTVTADAPADAQRAAMAIRARMGHR